MFFRALACSAQINSWTGSVSGNWQDSTWSLGIPPAASQSVMITNAGFKAVGIFPATAVNFPATMTVSNLTISAPSNSLNTLLLNYFGTAVPLRVSNDCTIGTNGILLSLFSGLQVGGDLNVSNGNFKEEGGVTVVTNGSILVTNGTVAVTNATLLFASAFLLSSNTTFVQSGGSVSGSVSVQFGTFNLESGMLSGGLTLGALGIGNFNQYAGTNSGVIIVGDDERNDTGNLTGSTYTLYGGMIQSPQTIVGGISRTYSTFSQYGGYVSNQNLQVGGSNIVSIGFYNLTNGVLFSSNIVVAGGVFYLFGGVSMAHNLSISGFIDTTNFGINSYGSELFLAGGILNSDHLSLGVQGTLTHDSGTNQVNGDLQMEGGSEYDMHGGTLSTSNTFIAPNIEPEPGELVDTIFFHNTGLHQVANTLSCAGFYYLGPGTLIAPNIILQGTLSIESLATTISNAVAFHFLGGTIRPGGSTQHLAAMTLGGNALMDFSAGGELTFANSSGQSWTNGVTLTVSNWSGSVSGGGTNELIFGNSASGLTAAQVQQIEFVNPAGFSPGTWPAKILPTGEIVPIAVPLSVAASGNNVVVQWPGSYVLQAATNLPGPFQDISTSSPYTNNTAQFPQRFFRLR